MLKMKIINLNKNETPVVEFYCYPFSQVVEKRLGKISQQVKKFKTKEKCLRKLKCL